jgi:glutathione S-transferase
VLPDGVVIDESLSLMQWALEQSDIFDLLRIGSSHQQASIHELIWQNDTHFKFHLDRFKYSDRFLAESAEDHKLAGLLMLRTWSQRIDHCNGWLLPHGCSLADGALWPFVRQWRIADPDGFDSDKTLASLRVWLLRFVEDPCFERLMRRAVPWHPGGSQHHFPADSFAVPGDQMLFHLALVEDWEVAIHIGHYNISTRGLSLAQVGFIHLSWREQVLTTHERFYADLTDVLLLCIDPSLLTAPLRADSSPSGELFPHLYGPLPVSSVVEVSPFSFLPAC